MGGCVSANYKGEHNNAPDLRRYVDLKIGQTFQHSGYCEYRQYGEKVNCGNNGEFEYGGNSNVGCKCRSACDNSLCRRKLCKRVKYSGTAAKCCQNAGSSYYMEGSRVRTCDPKYRLANWEKGTCDIHLDKYCKQGDNLFTKNACKLWVAKFRPTGNLERSLPNGLVDDVINTVCSRDENKNRDECACIVAANNLRKLSPSSNDIPVHCIYNSCANNTKALRVANQLTPCNVVNCEMTIGDIKLLSEQSGINANFVQNCTATNGSTNTEKNTGDTGGETDEITDNSNIIIFSLIGLFTLILFIVLIILIYKYRK